MTDQPAFAELVAATNFSYLRGASRPAEMVQCAFALGMAGIGVADRNSVTGVVRAHMAWRELNTGESGFRLVVGAGLVFSGGSPTWAGGRLWEECVETCRSRGS